MSKAHWARGALAGALVLSATSSLAGCRSSPNVGPPAVTTPASSEAKAPPPRERGPALPELRVLLDDPRLVVARAFDRAKDWAAAASALGDARPPSLSHPEACAWDYLEGRLFALAGAEPDALAAFERAESAACPLAAYAKLRSAQVLARAGRADEALARARAIPEEPATLRDEVNELVTESLLATGDRAGALPLWRDRLEANPRGRGWVSTSVSLANALLDGVGGPPEDRAREAYDLATRVVIEAPKLADGSGATKAREQSMALLRAKGGATLRLDDEQLARQAQAWLDANEATRAFDLASTLLKSASRATACRAAITRARAAAKKRPKGDGWADAVAACEKQPELVTALFAGARASSGKDPKRAIAWYAKVEERFPKHSYADDARMRAALIIAEDGEEAQVERAEQMLLSIPDDYPDGDMRAEALFRVALVKMRAGAKEDWARAMPVLDRIIEITGDDRRHWPTAGRAEYFRARASVASGDTEDALRRWERVVEKYPLSYYMLLSHARIAEVDAERARRVLDEAIARAEGGVFPSRAHETFADPAFTRAMRLLEVGDIEPARREMRASGAVADAADAEVVWTVGALYNRAGFPELGHSFSRRRLLDHLEHYPEGAWRLRWETAYPRAFEPLVRAACDKYSLPRDITWGVMREESTFVAEARSHANAFGLMQLIIPTAKGVAVGTGHGSDEASLKRPEVSIELGTKLLAALRRQQGHDALVLGAYNAGPGAVSRWMRNRTSDELDLFVENVPYDETRNYIKRVLSSIATYGYLYDKEAFERALRIPLRLGT